MISYSTHKKKQQQKETTLETNTKHLTKQQEEPSQPKTKLETIIQQKHSSLYCHSFHILGIRAL